MTFSLTLLRTRWVPLVLCWRALWTLSRNATCPQTITPRDYLSRERVEKQPTVKRLFKVKWAARVSGYRYTLCEKSTTFVSGFFVLFFFVHQPCNKVSFHWRLFDLLEKFSPEVQTNYSIILLTATKILQTYSVIFQSTLFWRYQLIFFLELHLFDITTDYLIDKEKIDRKWHRQMFY